MLFFFFFFDDPDKVHLSLSTLFDISVGVIDDGTQYFYIDEKGKRMPVKMLRMSSFDPENKNLKNIEEIKQNEKILLQRRQLKETKKNDDVEKNEKSASKKHNKKEDTIEAERLLHGEDYVICARSMESQKISGYSLQNSIIDFSPELGPFVLSHHFIHLKPRKDLEQLGYPMFIPFFHLLLDLIVEDLSRTKTKILKASTLKQYQISFPKKIEYQQEEFNKYKKYEIEYFDAKHKLNNAENEFNNYKKKLIEGIKS